MSSVLSARAISVSFGGVHAVIDVDLDVAPDELVGLIGPNGAGKTTFVDAITGFVHHRGTAALDGIDITRMSPHERSRLGLARTWQAIELFDDLTVRENLTVAAHHPSLLATLKDIVTNRLSRSSVVDEALEMFALEPFAEATPTELTQGQRKLVAVARALAARPKLLCLDEPAAGFNPAEKQDLMGLIRQIRDTGYTVLLIEHDMGLVMGVTDRIVVLDFGRKIAEGLPAEIRSNPDVIAAYLGEPHDVA